MPSRPPGVAFLFLGETLLIPHLYPIVEALARADAEVAIDCWVSTSVHEALVSGWLADAGLRGRVRMRRAPGFRRMPDAAAGADHPLPAKIPILVCLIPFLRSSRVVVCAEQTSLWLPKAMPFLGWRFIKAAHGAGSMMDRDDPRRRSAYRLLVPSASEKARLVAAGIAPERIVIVGYVKAGFHALATPRRLFADDKPVVVYAPHWQRRRSSWWRWGPEIVAMLAEQRRFNVILAPHQRLPLAEPEVRDVIAKVSPLSHVHADLGSFALVDGSYMGAADIYLGDTSSQVVEFLIRPRPCVFLNPEERAWRGDASYDFWECGEVVDALDGLPDALGRAIADHPRYAPVQRSYAARALGDARSDAADRAAAVILASLSG